MKGQLYDAWETCNRYLQHVLHLKDCFTDERRMSKTFKASSQFCKLLAQCQRFLYESNALTELESLCHVNLVAVNTLEDGPQKNDLKATIMTHQANLAESLGNAEKAIELNKGAYEIRLYENPLREVLLCYIANNLGYCHNTANDHKTALEWFQRSRNWWPASVESQGATRDCPPFILKNTGRCMVYLNDFKGAKQFLNISIPQLKNSKPSNWAMLAYAYFVQGTMERRQRKFEAAEAHFIEAQNSWLKGDQVRIHPFNGGCMYKIGVCCLDQGKVEAAIKHIRDSMEMTKLYRKNMPVEHARNLFKLSEALLQDEDVDDSSCEAKDLRDEAEIYLKRRKPDVTACDTEDAYDSLIPIFWR
ncbi:pfs domain-containing protein, partial [Metarhizium majus ARSEF 297]